MYAGRWITGSSGTQRLAQLSKELDRKHIEHTSKITEKNCSSYSPWMSCVDNLDFFAKKAIELKEEPHPFLIINQKTLKILSEGFSKNDAPFGNLQIEEPDGFYIEEKVDSNFQSSTERALNLIFSSNPLFEDRWKALIKMVIPVGFKKSKKSLLGRGLSTHFFRKGIFIQLPEVSEKSELQLALNLVHELGHQALITYQNADLIVETNRDVLVYSVIRKTQRPIIRSFHAFVVTGYMLEFLISTKNKDLPKILRKQIEEETLTLRKLIFTASTELRSAPVQFSQLGSEIIDELENLAACEGFND